ncbi:MAG: sigma-70 family RNA polymerase sigma factor [Candidatus Pacebacteria bacterium]|nr:sigma-70 family RNA polymerase sigma factor [Candidatus Paceibacterota bacterium]MDD5357223.1 sigma-70 family RNA polymerase sigma factor [Candidatus Paceibacterota bacterium]
MRRTDDENTRTLLEEAKKGDKHAFEEVYRLFFTPVYRYVYLRVKDKKLVEMLTQDVFIKVYSSLGQFQSKGASPLSYFFTVARNTIIDHWRKDRNKISFGKEDLMLVVPDTADNPEQSYEKQETKALLYKAVNMLKQDEREAISMRFLNEIPNKEIAKHMERTEESVRQLQSRGLKSLRVILLELSGSGEEKK